MTTNDWANDAAATSGLPWPGGIADRDWTRKARVRLRRDVGRSAPVGAPQRYRQGQVHFMAQGGRGGREITPQWWSSGDIDTAHIFDPEDVDVIEDLPDESHPPYWTEAALDTTRVVELLGQAARGWRDRGVIVVAHYGDWQVRRAAAPHELLGVVCGYRDHARECYAPMQPLTYRVSTDRHNDDPWHSVPAGPIPADPVAVTAQTRARQA